MTHALIIDDDLGNLGVLQQLLTLEHISYTSIQDSSQVEKILPRLPKIDIVFLDLEMPDVNGYEMLVLLKQHPALAGVPVVACTVHAGEVHRAREWGFHSFICKPLDADRFPTQIKDILSNAPIWEVR